MIYGRRRYQAHPVEVTATHTRTGLTIPRELTWDDGRRWQVEPTGHPRRAQATHTGTLAMLYPIALVTDNGRETRNLYRCKNGIWYVEVPEPPREGELTYEGLPYGDERRLPGFGEIVC